MRRTHLLGLFTKGIATYRYAFSAAIACSGDAPRVTPTATASPSYRW